MLYEAKIPIPSADRYMAHQTVERQTRDRIPFCRWGFKEEAIITMRSSVPLDESWQSVPVPAVGSLIRFVMDAHLRRTEKRLKRRRVSNTDYIANLNWIERQAPTMGLDLQGIDFDPITSVINHPERPFVMAASRFRGIAIVADLDSFETALVKNVGDAKAYGFGFVNYTTLKG